MWVAHPPPRALPYNRRQQNIHPRDPSFLQMGKPDNDFLVYLPVYDMWQEQPGRLLLFSTYNPQTAIIPFLNAMEFFPNT